ncbi:MAG: RNA polymerase sigma factor [Solirubrobacteraceae bacterium]
MSDAVLLVRARDDDDAFGVFYERYIDAVLAFFLKRLPNRELAADLAAETFAAALIAVPRYDPGLSPALAWLFMIAQRRLVDSLRRGTVEDDARRALGVERMVLTDRELERVEERAEAAQHGDALAILEGLSKEHRQAVEGRVLAEESYDELARRLRCSEAVVRQRVHRGLSELRSRLEGS